MSGARKPRSDAWHAGLTIEQRDQAYALCNSLGYAKAGPEIARELKLASVPSPKALSNWWADWPITRMLLDAGSLADQVKRALRDHPDLQIDTRQVEALGQAVFTAAAVRANNSDLFQGMRKLSQRDQELALDREKFQRETCETFLTWYADQRAREIADSDAPNADKIARLRQTYFADVDAFAKSGRLQIPA